MRPRIDPSWTPPVASRQAGAFTRAQAIDAGLTRRQADHRMRTGAWRRVVGAGLTSAGRMVDGPLLAAAVELTRPGSIVMGPVAAACFGAPIQLSPVVDIWIDGAGGRTYAGIRPRNVRLPHRDVVGLSVVAGELVRMSNERRSLVDSLAWLPLDDARRLLAWATTRRRVARSDLERRLTAEPGTRGNKQIRRLLDESSDGALSVAESRLHEILRRARIRGWEANVPISDVRGMIGVVDVLFRAEKVVVEVDGRRFHSDRFQEDRARDNRLGAAGYQVLRFTWADVTSRPDTVVTTIRETLARR